MRRLEALLAERLALIERLDRTESTVEAADLRGQLARLSHEQRLLLSDLAALVPPDETPSSASN
jgi:hypothetical protein